MKVTEFWNTTSYVALNYTLPHLLKYTESLQSRDILDGTNGVRIREVLLCMVCFPIWMALCKIVHMYHSNSQLTIWLGVNTQVHRAACWKRRETSETLLCNLVTKLTLMKVYNMTILCWCLHGRQRQPQIQRVACFKYFMKTECPDVGMRRFSEGYCQSTAWRPNVLR